MTFGIVLTIIGFILFPRATFTIFLFSVGQYALSSLFFLWILFRAAQSIEHYFFESEDTK